MTRTRFDLCLDEVLRHEGGYADHPRDPGGATNMGITRKTLAGWRKVSPWWNLPKTAIQKLERDEAARIYRASFWERTKASALPPGLDLAVFDYAVNSGPDRAIRALQTEVGAKADGHLGPLTIEAVRAHTAKSGLAGLIEALGTRRLNFLSRLSTFSTFGKGWTARVAAVQAVALQAAGENATTHHPHQWSTTMNILDGYKTYIVAAFMLLAGLMQILGLDLPALDGQAAGHMVMEALAVLFLRKGLRGDIARA